MLAFVFALIATFPGGDGQPVPVKLPSRDDSPIFRDGLPRAGDTTPIQRKKFFGLGVVFQARAGAQGVPLERVLPGSPADQAGLTVGTVIVEINGESTLGRGGDDCTRMIREAGNAVTIKFLDPATLKLRTRVVEKDWFLLPSAGE